MTAPAPIDVHTLLGDPDCGICDGTGEMVVLTYDRRPSRDDPDCCVCVEPYREAHTCQGCGEGYTTVPQVAACSCWADARLDNLSYALTRAADAATAAGMAA
jgi:hypothetical protein